MADKDRVKNYYKTKLGFVARIYNNQKAHSKARHQRLPEYSLEELREWLFSQTSFHVLFSEYKNSGYKRRLAPSINRKCNDVHYCMANIELMTWHKNKALGHIDRIHGHDGVGTAIIQKDLDGNIIGEYPTIMAAARELGKPRATGIGEVLSGNNKTAYGFVWEYKG